jgi:hypothetical protein
VMNVPVERGQDLGAAVAAVWASLYTRRAVLSRRAAGGWGCWCWGAKLGFGGYRAGLTLVSRRAAGGGGPGGWVGGTRWEGHGLAVPTFSATHPWCCTLHTSP